MRLKHLLSVFLTLLTLSVGQMWADSYTITFSNNANSATAISSSTQASTVIAQASRSYVNASPFTVTGNCYYGDTQSCIRIGKSGNDAELDIALSSSGQVSASTIVVNCMKMAGNKNTSATLSVNGATAQSAPASADNLTFTINDDITSITLTSVKALYVYSVTVNYTTTPSCSAPTSPNITGTTSYTAGQTISLTASATGTTSGTTTYQWYKGDPDNGGTSQGAASTSGATFTKANCVVGDAGTYYCVISNGTGCTAKTSKTITVAASACTKKVTLATGNPSNGTISFSPTGPVETCDGNVNVTMTITPNAGYYLSAYSKTGVNTSNTPSITTGTSATAAQTPTLTFAQNTNGTYTAGATFTAFVDHFIDEVQSSTGYTGEGMAKSGNYSNSLPTLSDKAVATTGNCQALHYHFIGWVLSDYKDSPAGHIATLNGHATGATYYAVWAKKGTGSSPSTISINATGLQDVVSDITSGYSQKTITIGGYNCTASAVTKSTQTGTSGWLQLKKNNDYILIPELPGAITNISSSSIKNASNGSVSTGVYFNSSATTSQAIASETLSNATSFSLDITGTAKGGYFLVGAATCINQLSITYTTIAYEDYITVCCNELGSINGSFFWSTLFEPLSPDKFRSHVLLCNHLFSSSHSRILHHLIYTMYISREVDFFSLIVS